jgi:Mce-associated membrane protein
MRRPSWRRADKSDNTEAVKDVEQIENLEVEPVLTATVDMEATDGAEEAATVATQPDEAPAAAPRSDPRWTRAIAYVVLPALALLLAGAVGFVKWQDISARTGTTAGPESVQAATDSTIALLSYKPETVEKDLEKARSRMTGQFLDSYTALTHDVVIPGAKQKQISAVATVPAAASVQASSNHAVVLLFVNQSVVIKDDAPTSTASTVRVTLDKIDGRWLISHFDPV